MMSAASVPASMEPGHEDREYMDPASFEPSFPMASMEPGHEDREYLAHSSLIARSADASMEPGHEDREYSQQKHRPPPISPPQWSPVMKTGNTCRPASRPRTSESRLNGARS